MNRWLLGGGVLLGMLLLSRKANASFITTPAQGDLDALASMLITETDFARDRAEMAQIVYVALNRAHKYDVSPYDIVRPPGHPVTWNSGATYRTRFADAPGNPRWAAARAFAAQVVAGTSPYSNSGARSFVHPTGMPTPPCSNGNATLTFAGVRCLPGWAAGGKTIGGAVFV